MARRLLKKQVPDAALRERLTPRHPIGCKRILISNDGPPTFSKPNVELVTEPIEAVNRPGFTTTYRWLTRGAGLGAYRVSRA